MPGGTLRIGVLAGEASGALNFWENTGSATNAVFTLVSDEFMDIDVGRRSLPVLRDHDGDGDLDLLVGSEGEGLRFYRNVGSPTAPDFVDEGPMALPDVEFAAPAFVDLDGDGDDDLLMGSQRGGLWYFEYR